MKVMIIGTGNVATVLGNRIKKAGHTITQLYGRTEAHARRLAVQLDVPYVTAAGDIDTHAADLYLLAVSDDAIAAVSNGLRLGERLLAHTAGSVPADVLKECSANYGVLYPLQSLRMELDPGAEIPLLTDGNNEATRTLLTAFARTLSGTVGAASDQERVKLHVAAVMASNFTNHFYAAAAYYCRQESLDFGLLYPLIQETASRVRLFPPALMQTGPAARNDQATISRHLQLLEAYPALHQLYILLSSSIQEKDNFAALPANT